MMGAALSIPITNGRLNMGTWQASARAHARLHRAQKQIKSSGTGAAVRGCKPVDCPAPVRRPCRASGCASTVTTAGGGVWW